MIIICHTNKSVQKVYTEKIYRMNSLAVQCCGEFIIDLPASDVHLLSVVQLSSAACSV